MSTIAENIAEFKTELASVCRDCDRNPSEISIVAVTKNRSSAEINSLLASGITAIGENRLQEFLAKKAEIGAAEKHFVGRIQSNKAAEIAREFDVVESVSSLKIAKILNDSIISRDVARNVSTTSHKTLPIFLQINLAREPQKDGFSPEEIESALSEISKFANLEVVGLMTIGVFGDTKRTREIFAAGKKLCEKFGLPKFSAGMSDDWPIAVECGATELRIGRLLFE
ncbi:MAG: YggS family pyridoxal phosphate-dependent enzyme [Candidatus Peribacteraceae bacterium]|nr:YggS family pyridoxal phosphate-dependent enzyme [Candidatus Peribacteraceae bacterium]